MFLLYRSTVSGAGSPTDHLMMHNSLVDFGFLLSFAGNDSNIPKLLPVSMAWTLTVCPLLYCHVSPFVQVSNL